MLDSSKDRSTVLKGRGYVVWPALVVGFGLPLLLVGLMLNATAALLVFLMAYAAAGAVFAFNVWGASDRAAESFHRAPWLFRQFGRDNPLAWRSAGLVMLATGVAVAFWLGVEAVWRPPEIKTSVAIGILVVTAIASTLLLIRALRRSKNAGS